MNVAYHELSPPHPETGVRACLLMALVLVSVLFAVGCASAQKDAADAAIASSTVAFAAVREDALRYAPSQAASVETALQSARGSLAKGDYSRALTVAKDIPSQIQELSASIKDRKDELREDWEELSATVPGLIRAVRSRIDYLSRAHKSTTSAQDVLADAQKQWKSANDAYTADELITAVSKASSTKGTLVALQADLNVKPEK